MRKQYTPYKNYALRWNQSQSTVVGKMLVILTVTANLSWVYRFALLGQRATLSHTQSLFLLYFINRSLWNVRAKKSYLDSKHNAWPKTCALTCFICKIFRRLQNFVSISLSPSVLSDWINERVAFLFFLHTKKNLSSCYQLTDWTWI